MILDFFEGHSPDRAMYEMVERPVLAARVATESPWEIPFALDIGLELPLVGYVDGLVKHRNTGELWALEWKTTSEDSARFLDGFRMNPQAVGYALALKMMGVEVQGTIVESLLVSKVKSATLANPIVVGDQLMEEFVKWARWKGEQLLASVKTGYFPKDLSHCNTYPCFGMAGFTCDHQPLCLVGDGWEDVAELMPRTKEREFVLESTPLGVKS
jgi:hypothetical protein